MKIQYVLSCIILTAAAHAGRTSASYTITTETTDAAGGRATSVNYTADASSGDRAGISTAPGEVAKHGFIGQLYDAKSLTLAGAATVNETAILQLAPVLTMDDDTLLALAPALIAWSVDSGPITGISASGLAAADVVFADMPTVVRGTYAAFTDDLTLTVLDTIPDNYGGYAGDGLLDAWQFQYFGAENALAAPGLDPDGDGQTNLFEFTAGLSPIDPASRFTLRLENVPGQPTQKRVVFTPRLSDRSYSVKARSSLAPGVWEDLISITESDNGDERTVTDLDAATQSKFYRVEITKP